MSGCSFAGTAANAPLSGAATIAKPENITNKDSLEISFKPLIARRFRMKPEDCSCIFGKTKCKRKVRKGKCPTKVTETTQCGGWADNIRQPEFLSSVLQT